MLKILTTGIVSTTLAIGLSGCGKSEVPNEELKGLVVCSKQPTGMATHKVTIANAVSNFRRGGWKTIVEKMVQYYIWKQDRKKVNYFLHLKRWIQKNYQNII